MPASVPTLTTTTPDTSIADKSFARHLAKEYQAQQALYDAQPLIVQRFCEAQARQVADAVIRNLQQVRFTLPDRVMALDSETKKTRLLLIPLNLREQLAGGLIDKITRTSLQTILNQRMLELDHSPSEALGIASRLLRHAIAMMMVHDMLPAGRSVSYTTIEGEEIPSLPIADELEPESALTAQTDAIAEENQDDEGRGELLVPYVPFARRFYLPQWVAFDEDDHLLVNSVYEAQANIQSMQNYLAVLHSAIGIAPYIIADEDYQTKRYGMLGQLVYQGRALARYETEEIIAIIKQRSSNEDLNRGLSLSLPYFDDRQLLMKTHDFEVIPAGRIMFLPAFVVRACQFEYAKVAQDTRLSLSTRKHILIELKRLEQAFLDYKLR